MRTLLDNFLDISKIEQEAFDINIAETDVASVAENVIRINEDSGEERAEARSAD